MQPRRNVKQNASGRWDVMKDGHLRGADSADTQRAALTKARDQVRREGGGEVRVMDRTGKIVSSTTVRGAASPASRRPRSRAA